MLFNPGLGEAARAKLKIISGNYLKVYDISRRSRGYFKLPSSTIVISNIVLHREMYSHDQITATQVVRFEIFVSADKVSGRKKSERKGS